VSRADEVGDPKPLPPITAATHARGRRPQMRRYLLKVSLLVLAACIAAAVPAAAESPRCAALANSALAEPDTRRPFVRSHSSGRAFSFAAGKTALPTTRIAT